VAVQLHRDRNPFRRPALQSPTRLQIGSLRYEYSTRKSIRGEQPVTVGADKGYDTNAFVMGEATQPTSSQCAIPQGLPYRIFT
jgi:hypothetical protein